MLFSSLSPSLFLGYKYHSSSASLNADCSSSSSGSTYSGLKVEFLVQIVLKSFNYLCSTDQITLSYPTYMNNKLCNLSTQRPMSFVFHGFNITSAVAIHPKTIFLDFRLEQLSSNLSVALIYRFPDWICSIYGKI